MQYHLAQFNIAKAKAPLSDPVMRGFVKNLARINQLADQSPGFVWRIQTPEGDATRIRVYDDHLVFITLSVWEGVESLECFSYQARHGALLRQRASWFVHLEEPYIVLWWIKAGSLPTIDEAKQKLERLRALGSTPEAFTFDGRFPHPS